MTQTNSIGAPAPTTATTGTESIFLGADLTLMGPGDVLAYFAKAMDNVGLQLKDFQNVVEERQAQAKEFRELLTEARRFGKGGGEVKDLPPEEYAAFMARLAKHAESNPQIDAAYDQLLKSYGGYIDPETKAEVGTLAMDDGDKHDLHLNLLDPKKDTQNAHLNQDEWNNVVKNLEESLTNLNSSNELTMMKLQTLMQQRTQLTQFATNMLSQLNESAKSILTNLRG